MGYDEMERLSRATPGRHAPVMNCGIGLAVIRIANAFAARDFAPGLAASAGVATGLILGLLTVLAGA